MLLISLGGCTAMLQVQTLATGRSDMSAYALSGGDLDALRQEAQRLCPLGGEIVRQFGQQHRPEQTGGRWRHVLNTTLQWVDPPPQSAQLVVLCHEPRERLLLQAAAAPVVARVASAPAAPTTGPAVAPQAASSAPAAGAVELSAALPIGPVTPEW